MTKTPDQLTALAAAHVSTRALYGRSDVPQPPEVRRAVYAFLREMMRKAEDARNAEGVRHVR